MRWFRSQLEGAGLASLGAYPPVIALLLLGMSAGVVIQSIFNVYALTLFCVIGALAMTVEIISTLATKRRRELSLLWPEVIDALQSGVVSGLSLTDSFGDLAERGPKQLRPYFLRTVNALDGGQPLVAVLEDLKAQLGEVNADKTIEILRLVSLTGSDTLGSVLHQQSTTLRSELNLVGQIESKQGWVVGTAKLAVVAPWIIVAMLSTRSENANIYNSSSGAAILLIGFAISVFAYRLVHFLGALPTKPRIWQS